MIQNFYTLCLWVKICRCRTCDHGVVKLNITTVAILSRNSVRTRQLFVSTTEMYSIVRACLVAPVHPSHILVQEEQQYVIDQPRAMQACSLKCLAEDRSRICL